MSVFLFTEVATLCVLMAKGKKNNKKKKTKTILS